MEPFNLPRPGSRAAVWSKPFLARRRALPVLAVPLRPAARRWPKNALVLGILRSLTWCNLPLGRRERRLRQGTDGS